jgi:hypothetical protein
VNNETITIDDCLDMFEKKGRTTLIENGQVIGFRKETEDSVK